MNLKNTVVTVVKIGNEYEIYLDGGIPLHEEHKRTISCAFKTVGHRIFPEEAPPQP